MKKKLAKLKYLPNNFQIIENGDYVECAVSGKKISLENLHETDNNITITYLEKQIFCNHLEHLIVTFQQKEFVL